MQQLSISFSSLLIIMEKPRQKIRKLQQSIDHTKTQIKFLTNQRNRSLIFLDNAMQKTVPKLKQIIRKSIINDSKVRNFSEPSSQQQLSSSSKFKKISMRNSICEKNKLKEEIYKKKALVYNRMKQESLFNRSLIQVGKKKEAEEKQKRKLQIRQSEAKTKQLVKTFFEEKKKSIEQRKQEEYRRAERTVNFLQSKYHKLENQHFNVIRLNREASSNLSTFRKNCEILRKMNSNEVLQVSERARVWPSEKMKVKDLRKFFSQIYLQKQNINN